MLHWILLAALGFLSGSVPFGLLIARARGVDIRAHGSGNIGATNVWRVLGPRAGALCFTLDVLKGLAPTLGAGLAMGWAWTRDLAPADAWAWLGVMAAPVLGHMLSPWVGFRGGKGVATGLGALLGVLPQLSVPGLAALAVWIGVARAWRYVSLASIAAAGVLPIATGAWLSAWSPGSVGGGTWWAFVLVTGTLAGLVIVKHRANIRRLRDGTENRIGARTPPAG